MSGRHKNNHYHYAEKFEHRRRSAAGKRAFMPFKSVIISLVVLLMFGLVCTTFSVYVSDTEPTDAAEFSPIISEVRNMKASRDIALTGANADLAETGGNVSGGYVYFEAPSGWDTSTYSHVQFCLYQNGYLWCSDDMTNISGTRIWYGTAPNHSSWNNEQIMFFANSSHYGSGDYDGTNAHYYTAKRTQAMSSGTYYFYQPSGSSNPYTNNAPSTSSSLKGGIIKTYDQTASVSTTGTGTGGSVKITASWFDDSEMKAKETTTPTSTSSVTYEDAMYHTSATFIATTNTGYRFDGWYNGSTLVSSSTSYTISSVTGTNSLTAKYTASYTVTVAKNPSDYSGSPTANSDTTSATVYAGDTVTLAADVKTGVTFGGWTMGGSYTVSSGSVNSTSFTIIPTSSFTATASYTLQKPTSVSLSYPDAITANGTDSSAPTKAATSPSSGTLSYTYTIAPQSGTTADSGTYDVDASGNVTATTPGKYTVTMSVTTSNYNLTSAATTATATVTVKPIAVPVSDIVWTASDYTSGEGTSTVPFKTPVNRTKFKIESYIPAASRNANYTYNWTRTDGEYLDNNGTITIYAGSRTVTSENVYTVSDTATSGTATTDVIHNTVPAANTGYIYKIAVTTNQNGVSSDPTYVTIYYGVTADFLNVESFDFSSFNATDKIQEIYAEDNNITAIDATYDAGGTDTFNTMLWFSSNNIDFNKVAVWAPNTFRILTGMFANPAPADAYSALPNDTNHTVSALIESLPTVARNNVNLMQTTGPKWFRAYVDDYNNPRVDAVYPWLHTTVGTASTVGDRPIYYVDQALATDVNVNSRVMAFYLTEADNTVHYQTAQTVSSKSNTYRFYIPSDATYITFAHVADNNYLIPTVDTTNGVTLSYTNYASSVLKAWTPTIDLNSSANEGMTTYIADTPGSPSNGIYNYTNTANSGNMTTFG